jgi:hypothetical protein
MEVGIRENPLKRKTSHTIKIGQEAEKTTHESVG